MKATTAPSSARMMALTSSGVVRSDKPTWRKTNIDRGGREKRVIGVDRGREGLGLLGCEERLPLCLLAVDKRHMKRE